MPIFGITASSNMTTKLTDFFQIATTTLGSAQASIEFTGIPSTYTHFQVRGIGRSTFADTDANVYMQFNSDTANNYSYHYVYGNGSLVGSGSATSQPETLVGRITAANSTANRFGTMFADILDYTNTNKFKTVRSITGHDQNGSGTVWLFSSNWRSTNAVTSIKLYPSAGSFAQYSSFQLYGVKA